MAVQETITKFRAMLSDCPWLLGSKNIVDMPFKDPNAPKDKPSQTLPSVTWPELNELLDYAADLDGPRAGKFAAVNTKVGVEGTKMANYFSAERIAELNAGHREVYRQFRELQERFFLRTYKSERGAEYAKHGFCRRLETLVRTIDQVYELLPPQQEKIPDRDNVVDGTIAIQAFTMNAFGCLENIAWVWLYEKNVKNDDGTDFDPMDVGLGKKKLRKALTQQFRDYLDRKRDWLENLIEFRDSLAHRIPLFIPPYVVPMANAAKYREFEKAKWEEPARSDPEEYEKVKAEQLKLCQFMPGMTHSIFEASQVEFHSQLLNDYVTIDEYGRTLLNELDRDAE
jgi:hypothetical protein